MDRQEIQARLTNWGLCCNKGARIKQQVPLLAHTLGVGGELFLYGVRVGVCPGVGLEEWLRCFVHPLGVTVCRGHAQYPAFAPGSSKLAVGFFGLCIFCPEFFPTAVSFSGIQFLGVLLLMDQCLQVQALQLCSSSGF